MTVKVCLWRKAPTVCEQDVPKFFYAPGFLLLGGLGMVLCLSQTQRCVHKARLYAEREMFYAILYATTIVLGLEMRKCALIEILQTKQGIC